MGTEKASWQDRDKFIGDSWNALMRAFNADADIAGNCLQEIVKAYSGKSRYYHNLDHIIAKFIHIKLGQK